VPSSPTAPWYQSGPVPGPNTPGAPGAPAPGPAPVPRLPVPAQGGAAAVGAGSILAALIRRNPWFLLAMGAWWLLGNYLMPKIPGGWQHPDGAELMENCPENPPNQGPCRTGGECDITYYMNTTWFANVPSYYTAGGYHTWWYHYHNGTFNSAGRPWTRLSSRWRVAIGADMGALQPPLASFAFPHDPWLLPSTPPIPGYPDYLPIMQPTMPSLPAPIMPTTAPSLSPSAPYQTVRGPSSYYSPGRNTTPAPPLTGKQIVISSSGTPPSRRDISRSEQRQPRRGKEKKGRVKGAYGAVVGLWDDVGEVLDLVEALNGALPTAWQGDRNSPWSMFNALYDGWQYLDAKKAIENIIANQIEDAIVGRANKAAAIPRGVSGPNLGVGVAL